MHFSQIQHCLVTDGWNRSASCLCQAAKPLRNLEGTARVAVAAITWANFLLNLFQPISCNAVACLTHLGRSALMFQSMVVLYTINLHLKHPGHLRSVPLPFRVH